MKEDTNGDMESSGDVVNVGDVNGDEEVFGGDEFENELKGSAQEDSEDDDNSKEFDTYPADCYSFMSIHGPTSGYFYCGFIVWAFQVRADRCFLQETPGLRLDSCFAANPQCLDGMRES